MRLKIGKVGVKKDVGKIGDVRQNWVEINRICVLRGY